MTDPRVIPDTVETLLDEAGSVMTATEIHETLEQHLGTAVSFAIIRDVLSERSRTGRLLKIRHGLYASATSALRVSPPVDDTVVAVLTAAGAPLKLSDIHARCEVVLEGPVSYVAVKTSASRLTAKQWLTKVDHGWYEIAARRKQQPQSRVGEPANIQRGGVQGVKGCRAAVGGEGSCRRLLR